MTFISIFYLLNENLFNNCQLQQRNISSGILSNFHSRDCLVREGMLFGKKKKNIKLKNKIHKTKYY